ncbi:methyl-accepting chemotaxis protein [Rubrivivax gelatinosus]|uniref:methyl-accepting chemotaxis protein n=1 Tax=Rubrivivax gelatinosus TaxID=28068 RepID=UPI00067FDDC6|nr:methyl-accepting chemotaxis protein [Rubrivivax gelatinosus]
MRALAQRSAQAATEIKSLIGASVDRVEAGSRLVADAGATMQDIVGQVGRVAELVGRISAATGEQRDGLEQVNVAVASLDRMTQQNAALVEQSSASAKALEDQSAQLSDQVARFQVAGA